MKDKLTKMKESLRKLHNLQQQVKSEAEEIRTYYKHQNEETRSISEDFIVNIANDGDPEEAEAFIDDLIAYEDGDL